MTRNRVLNSFSATHDLTNIKFNLVQDPELIAVQNIYLTIHCGINIIYSECTYGSGEDYECHLRVEIQLSVDLWDSSALPS